MVKVSLSILFCTGRLSFQYKAYATLTETPLHYGVKVSPWRTAADFCTSAREGGGECYISVSVALSSFLLFMHRSTGFVAAALRCVKKC